MIPKSQINKVPQEIGVYLLFSKRKRLVYIGKAKNLRKRLIEHKREFEKFKNHIKKFKVTASFPVKPFEYVKYIITKNYSKLEEDLIELYNPLYNNSSIMYKNKKYEKLRLKELINSYLK